jgi:hypothetical protein
VKGIRGEQHHLERLSAESRELKVITLGLAPSLSACSNTLADRSSASLRYDLERSRAGVCRDRQELQYESIA